MKDKVKIYFRKPYQRLSEGELPYCIVGLSKRDYYYHDRKIIQWKYKLVIDLWLFSLGFQWIYPRLKLKREDL